MFEQIKRLGTDTAIYGISTILGRFLNFLLVPFYTNVLNPGEYGIVAYVFSIIAFMNVIYSYGMESAYFKYASSKELGTDREQFGTPFLSLFGTSILFSALIALLAQPIGEVLEVPAIHRSVIYYAAGILALDAFAILPFAALRHERKSRTFALVKFLNIVINVAMNIVLLVVFGMGVEGIFISGLVASGATIIMLVPVITSHIPLSFNRQLWRALVAFALPIVPSGLAAMAMQVIDRPILRAMTDDATVGIYQANYRLGILMMLVVSMYDYAWRPFFFSTAMDPNAKTIFARVLTYLVLFMSGIFLVLTFFVEDLVKIQVFGRFIIHPNYWDGLGIVPVVLAAYVFLGIATNLSAGLYIEKKTRFVPIGTIIGAVVNVVANLILIPRIGMMGAAWATLLAYVAMAASVYVLSNRVYPIKYEHGRLGKIAFAIGIIILVYYIFPPGYGYLTVLYKIGLLAFFFSMMYWMKFFEGKELAMLQGIIRRPRTSTTASENKISPDAGGIAE